MTATGDTVSIESVGHWERIAMWTILYLQIHKQGIFIFLFIFFSNSSQQSSAVFSLKIWHFLLNWILSIFFFFWILSWIKLFLNFIFGLSIASIQKWTWVLDTDPTTCWTLAIFNGFLGMFYIDIQIIFLCANIVLYLPF